MSEIIQKNEPYEVQVELVQQEIQRLLKQLPLDSLKFVLQFTTFLVQQMPNALSFGQNNFKPKQIEQNEVNIVTVPPSSLTGLIGLMPAGYEGDALEDTEALYDDI